MIDKHCECGMWIYTPKQQNIHHSPVSKNGETTSEHKEILKDKHWSELYNTVTTERARVNNQTVDF